MVRIYWKVYGSEWDYKSAPMTRQAAETKAGEMFSDPLIYEITIKEIEQ